MLISLLSATYKYIFKRIFFLFDPETVHELTTGLAELMGKFPFIIPVLSFFFAKKSQIIKQKIAGINFDGPMGLAAGFDYEAKTTQILSGMGFGFQTIGTISNQEYKGNPRPRLGRLPQSKSLMVNKGFKNKGADWTAEKLSKLYFKIPLGVSIGKTNIKSCDTQEKAITDIMRAFKIFEEKGVKNSYYELNISCPNLYGDVSFYPPENLENLLKEVEKLKLKKPIFIKMPINESNPSVRKMMDVIIKHNIAGVIFGNLQKDKSNPAIIKEELKWQKGNYSGLPTRRRSDELISLAYRNYGKKLVIIGCGGVFCAEDAYRKIRLGASLVQLITGLIYEGPLLVAKINKDLPKLLKEDGFKNISEAIGSDL